MRIKSTFLFLLLLILPMTVLASNDSQENFIDIKSLKELVLKTNRDIKLAQLEVEIAILQLTNARADDLLHASFVEVKKAENYVSDAKRNLLSTKQKVVLEAEKCYYKLLKACRQRDIALDLESHAMEQFKILQARYEQGLAASHDIATAELVLMQANNQLKIIEAELHLARQSLLALVNLTLDMEFAVNDSDFSFVELGCDPDSIRQLLAANNPHLQQIAAQLELARIEEHIFDSVFTAPLVQEIVLLERKKLEILYEQDFELLYLQALEFINRLLQLAAEYGECLKKVEIAEEHMRIVKLRYLEGLELKPAVMGCEIELNQAKLDLISTLFDYNIIKSQFKNLVGLE